MKSNIIHLFSTILILAMAATNAFAQQKEQITRIARIEVDIAQLKEYNAALKEQMAAAIKKEAGVLTYYAVADKLHPEKITILEIYANQAAYERHIQTDHFKKYKATVEHMVKSLELTNVDVIGIAKKPGL